MGAAGFDRKQQKSAHQHLRLFDGLTRLCPRLLLTSMLKTGKDRFDKNNWT